LTESCHECAAPLPEGRWMLNTKDINWIGGNKQNPQSCLAQKKPLIPKQLTNPSCLTKEKFGKVEL
jgi:hypothetical protein